eukprot:7063597-Pyramimonas_sp.AAC.2
MGRSSRGPNFEKIPWFWSHGDGLRRTAVPTCDPHELRLTKDGGQPLAKDGVERAEQQWENLDEEQWKKIGDIMK